MRIAAALLLCLTLAPAALAEPPAVTYRSYAQVALYPERDAPATAVSDNESRIAAEIAATIVAVPVEVGQVVPKGAVVARLDCRDYELAVHKAQAAHESALARARLAQAQLKRAAELHRQAFISAEALSQRETEYAVQQADVKLSRAQLDTARHNRQKCTLRAPFPAIVKARPGQVGELAAPGTPLLVLVDAGGTEVSAQVQLKDVDSLEAAQEVRFLGLDGAYPVKLLRVSPAVNRDARNVEARLAFTGKRAAPGSDGRIVWRDHRPHLPADLVSRRDGRLGVFVIDGGRARFVPLPQAQEGRPAPAPLPPEAKIVIDGRHGLHDGQAFSSVR